MPTDPWAEFEDAGGPSASAPKFDEGRFQSWYHGLAKKLDLNTNPDDPQHFYDYRAAYRAGATPDATGHWPSQFKLEGHPRLIIDGVDTRTGESAASAGVVGGSSSTASHDPWAEFEDVKGPEAGPPKRVPGSYPAYDVPLPDPGVVAATAPIALAPLGGAAVGAARGALATPIGRGVATTAAIKGFEHVTGVNVPWWLETAAEVASGGSAIKVGGRSLLKGALRTIMKGEAAPVAAEVAAPVVAKAAKATATAVAEALPEAATFHGDKVWKVGERVFTNAKEALQHAHSLKRAAAMAGQSAPAAAKVVAETVGKAATTAAPIVSGVARHTALLKFAKEVAATKPKVGQKIWMLLDDAGMPIKHLTPDQAGAAERAGQAVTWMKNIFR